MDNPWRNEFRQRMSTFDEHAHGDDGLAVSIKVRVTSGCFHREHSPQAYRMIDEYLQLHAPEDARWSFQEHESGPELLVYLAVTTAGLSVAASIINLVTAIIKARGGRHQEGGPSRRSARNHRPWAPSGWGVLRRTDSSRRFAVAVGARSG